MIGFIMGWLFYAISCLWLEANIAPLIASPDKPRLPYGQEAMLMAIGAGVLGLVFERMLRLADSDKGKAGSLGIQLSIFSLLVNVFLCAVSTPKNYSWLNASNIALFGPTVTMSIALLLRGTVLMSQNRRTSPEQ